MKRLFILVLALFMVFGLTNLVKADLMFNLDFEQDGNYENYWELKPGETVLIDIYVSNVPSPGLVDIGFDIVYNSDQLEVASANIEKGNWDRKDSRVTRTFLEIEMIGGRLESGLSGDNIKLGTIELKCKALGISELWLYDSDRGGNYDDFVLANGTVLDDQIVNRVKLAEINNIPIPGTLLLLGSGLIGLLGLGRRMLTH